MTSDADGPALFSYGVDRGERAVHEHAGGRNVLAVLTDSTTDEWHRRLERSRAAVEQVAIVECFDFVRGNAAAAQPTVVTDDLAVAPVERPIEAERLRSTLDRFLDGWAEHGSDTVVYVESLDALLGDVDQPTVEMLLEHLRERTEQDGSGLIAGISPDCPPRSAVAFSSVLDAVVGQPSFADDAEVAIRRLRLRDPTTFGYFRSYWREALAALDRTDRTYVQAGQLETEISSRMLGATLSALARLDALSVRANTNGPNRYDCRSYDPERAAILGLTVDALPE
ncbi:MAG: DUF7504 family protein [Halolamina sp.]